MRVGTRESAREIERERERVRDRNRERESNRPQAAVGLGLPPLYGQKYHSVLLRVPKKILSV